MDDNANVLLVIGASSDMGMALIKSTHQRYDHIIAHYRRMSGELEELSRELQDRLILIQADLSREEEVTHLIDEIRDKQLFPTHIVHFPAPQCNNQRFHKIEWETIQNELDISLRSLVLILKAFLPAMVRNRAGKIVLMLSFVVNGMPPKYCSNYVVTKYALLGLMRALAVEYADKGITVNGVSPAWVETKYIHNMSSVLVEQNKQLSPIGRNLVPADIVPAIEFLLSGKAGCINGENLSITCGR